MDTLRVRRPPSGIKTCHHLAKLFKDGQIDRLGEERPRHALETPLVELGEIKLFPVARERGASGPWVSV